MCTERSLPTQRFDAEHLSINSYIYLPERYKLPLRIDMTAKIDAPGLYVLLGNGHINFGTLWSDNRRIDDIVSPTRKPVFFHNHMNMNEFTSISLLYDLNEMQIMINDEERYYSKKERYMKSQAFNDMNSEGFELKIASDKMTTLIIKSLSITEYDDTCGIIRPGEEPPAPVTRNEAAVSGGKPTFDECISRLPPQIRNEIVETDRYLKSLKLFRFKKQIEKNGNKITYVAADYGFSYAIYLSNDIFEHTLQWYILTNGKPETWHRKADMMEETLRSLYVASPDFAERMFFNLCDCVGCYRNCLGRTRYQFLEKHKNTCHGKLQFSMSPSGFEDARKFINEISRLAQ
jgi:hypothetical protein